MNVATAIAARNGSPIASAPQMINSTPHTIPHFERCLMTANGFGTAVAIVVPFRPESGLPLCWKVWSAHCARAAVATQYVNGHQEEFTSDVAKENSPQTQSRKRLLSQSRRIVCHRSKAD